jgi:hypothetical protein
MDHHANFEMVLALAGDHMGWVKIPAWIPRHTLSSQGFRDFCDNRIQRRPVASCIRPLFGLIFQFLTPLLPLIALLRHLFDPSVEKLE